MKTTITRTKRIKEEIEIPDYFHDDINVYKLDGDMVHRVSMDGTSYGTPKISYCYALQDDNIIINEATRDDFIEAKRRLQSQIKNI